jgi:hypothetical protein
MEAYNGGHLDLTGVVRTGKLREEEKNVSLCIWK